MKQLGKYEHSSNTASITPIQINILRILNVSGSTVVSSFVHTPTLCPNIFGLCLTRFMWSCHQANTS